MSPQPNPPRVLIAGAGIAGLVAGLALLQRGIAVDIFEQVAELRELGAGVQLSANGTRVLVALGLEQQMQAISAEPSGKQIRLFSTGRTWKLFDLGVSSRALYGAPYWMVHRGDFHRVLCEAYNAHAPGRLHLDARCIGFDEDAGGIALRFADGATHRGDVVVGADGVHSEIRRQIGGDSKPFFAGVAAWRGLVPMERLPATMQRDVGTNWVGPGGHVVTYPVRRGELLNFVGVFEGESWPVESWTERGTREACSASFAGWNPEIHTLIENIDVPYKWALLGRDPLERFATGRACLIGDAAHPTLPFLAQGANMAIEDGMVLARCLEAFPVAEALQRYQRARIERTNSIVTKSTENAGRFHNPALAHAEGANDYVSREWQPERVRERYDWLFTYDALSVAI
ncbi:MAG: FAD-dependent monooxygenase [Acetobacteraceae bacterium]|nr:FAD-dependent monooxygenase [Acetobacteraceae bacterium]